jgi:hypothetical protein
MAAGAMGFGGIAQGAAEIAQILFYIFSRFAERSSWRESSLRRS